MDANRKKELLVTLDKMEHAAQVFYAHAQQTHFHQFLEFTGFMREYTKMCRGQLERGVDFTQESGELLPHEARYIGEKFGCIFTPLFKHSTFEDFLHGAKIRGDR